MACHAAVVSLGETIERLLQSSKLNREINKLAKLAHDKVLAVQNLLRKLDVSSGLVDNENDPIDIFSDQWRNLLSELLKHGISRGQSCRSIGGQRMNGLDGKMRDAARELEDELETFLLLLNQQLDDLQQQEKLKQDIESFSRKVMELTEEYAKNEAEEETEEFDDEDRTDDDDYLSSKMVGYLDVLRELKDDDLHSHCGKRNKNVRVLVGMAGIGKTTLARRIFDDPQVSDWYDYRVWVTAGPKYQLVHILESILYQVNPNTTTGYKLIGGDELVSQFNATLKDRRCLIVLDDVWNREIIPLVIVLLRKINYSMLLVTSRLEKIVAAYPWHIQMIKLRFMNKDESWDLLRHKVFGEDLSPMTCTPELAKAGKKIAENCEGLPLTIVTVADILSKRADDTTMTPEYWNQVAEGRNSVFVDAYRKMSKVLLRSYEFLPRHLKEYFLYMGVFPQKYNVPLSKLALLWGVEGCILSKRASIPSKKSNDFQSHVSRNMKELIGKSLVLVRKTTFKNKPKTYGLHSALWHSCVGEAAKNKFFHVFNKYADILEAERMRNQRRLCIHNNVLFSIKDVCNSMASISTARSLLCTGPHHRYPVPVCFVHFRLLRVIDALTVRFYEFPAEVEELVLLRYLALTCDGKLPNSISKLSILEILIIRRYLNIVKLNKKYKSYLPMEIWDMKELQHLQVMGDDLPEPRAGVVLPNLVTLMDANACSYTEGVLKGLPKLKKLGIRIELSADDAEPLSISCHNNELESLKCVVVNPVFRLSPIVSSFILSNNLKTLSLNGLGWSWKDFDEVASMPNLEVLKLRCYAFRGEVWYSPENGFRSLEFLLIEDTDLVRWIVGNGSFSWLRCLVLKECYKLKDIKLGLYNTRLFNNLNRIELVDCSPSAVACVKRMEAKRSTELEVFVHSSWDDGGKKLKA